MSKKLKIEIKNRFTGNILFEYESEGNTIKQTLLKAIESGADLRDADLCGADLCDADLCGANLRGADLCDADLCGADLRCANLCGANLRGANLRDANLRGIVIGYNDRLEGYGDASEIINNIKENSNLIPTEVHVNHDSFSSRWGAWWRNLLIVRKWKVKEKVEQAEDTAEPANEAAPAPVDDEGDTPDGATNSYVDRITFEKYVAETNEKLDKIMEKLGGSDEK